MVLLLAQVSELTSGPARRPAKKRAEARPAREGGGSEVLGGDGHRVFLEQGDSLFSVGRIVTPKVTRTFFSEDADAGADAGANQHVAVGHPRDPGATTSTSGGGGHGGAPPAQGVIGAGKEVGRGGVLGLGHFRLQSRVVE